MNPLFIALIILCTLHPKCLIGEESNCPDCGKANGRVNVLRLGKTAHWDQRQLPVNDNKNDKKFVQWVLPGSVFKNEREAFNYLEEMKLHKSCSELSICSRKVDVLPLQPGQLQNSLKFILELSKEVNKDSISFSGPAKDLHVVSDFKLELTHMDGCEHKLVFLPRLKNISNLPIRNPTKVKVKTGSCDSQCLSSLSTHQIHRLKFETVFSFNRDQFSWKATVSEKDTAMLEGTFSVPQEILNIAGSFLTEETEIPVTFGEEDFLWNYTSNSPNKLVLKLKKQHVHISSSTFKQYPVKLVARGTFPQGAIETREVRFVRLILPDQFLKTTLLPPSGWTVFGFKNATSTNFKVPDKKGVQSDTQTCFLILSKNDSVSTFSLTLPELVSIDQATEFEKRIQAAITSMDKLRTIESDWNLPCHSLFSILDSKNELSKRLKTIQKILTGKALTQVLNCDCKKKEASNSNAQTGSSNNSPGNISSGFRLPVQVALNDKAGFPQSEFLSPPPETSPPGKASSQTPSTTQSLSAMFKVAYTGGNHKGETTLNTLLSLDQRFLKSCFSLVAKNQSLPSQERQNHKFVIQQIQCRLETLRRLAVGKPCE